MMSLKPTAEPVVLTYVALVMALDAVLLCSQPQLKVLVLLCPCNTYQDIVITTRAVVLSPQPAVIIKQKHSSRPVTLANVAAAGQQSMTVW
jgi:hypothetical protein